MRRRRKVLVLTPYPLLPAHSGGRLYALSTVAPVADEHEFHLLALANTVERDEIARGGDALRAEYARFFASQLGSVDTIILVAQDEESSEIVGYAYAGLEDRNWAELRDACARLHDVFVVERVRRQGLARRMLRECIQRLTALSAPLAVTTTAFQNEVSQALLRSLGFRPASLEMAMDLK